MSNLQSILYELKPCDLSSPYVFISYSSLDSELVWQDVREFQKRGYNVWIDEKNLDKTKPSWREDAINAIEDMECELVVFYVSANSLRSDACYQELSKTVDERTRAMHFGPVKFIAVDAESVGDITAFARKVHQNIRAGNLDKAERSRQALALNGFMRDFFNSNNEKVRIHPKNEVNRKIDYYDDVTASFPDITRVFEPEEDVAEERPEPAAEVEEKAVAGAEPATESGTVKAESKTAVETEIRLAVEKEPVTEVKTAGTMPGMDELLRSMNQILQETPESEEEQMVSQRPKAPKMEQMVTQNPKAPKTEQKTTQDPKEPEMEKMTTQSPIAPGAEQIVQSPRETEEGQITLPLPEPSLSDRKATQIDASWFTKSEGTAPKRAQNYFGKREANSTPIRSGVLEIPTGYSSIMTKLGHSLYWGNDKIVDLILPDTMTELNIGEFQKCAKMKTVRLPKYLKRMPSEAFRDCTSLKEIVVPGNVEKIDHSAFRGCKSLQKAVFPEGLKTIDSHVFEGCTSLKEIHLPPQLEKLGMHAFSGCSSLKRVDLPSGLMKMEICCFQDCTSLEKVHIPGSLTRIASSAFKNCSSLKLVIIDEGVERIDSAFDRCGKGEVHVHIPDSVTSIDSIAFYKTTPVIHCNAGSYAEGFAKRNSYACILN